MASDGHAEVMHENTKLVRSKRRKKLQNKRMCFNYNSHYNCTPDLGNERMWCNNDLAKDGH